MNADDTALELFAEIKAGVGEDWDDLLDEAKSELEETARFMAQLVVRQSEGHDVEQDAKHVEAQIANWTFVGAAAAERSIWEFVLKVAEVAGTGLAAVAKKAIGL
jgi:cellobiose-specific phosphotransferase system component IIA